MRTLRVLSLSDIKLGLDDLHQKRAAALLASTTGQSYEPMILKRRDMVNALPDALAGGKPLVIELGIMDAFHDGFGASGWYVLEGYFRNPKTPPDVLDAAKRIRAAFLPALGELRASYATEAEAAIKRKPLLITLEADLKMFPIAGGLTLLDWVTDFLDAGQSLNDLLSTRADVDASGRKDASKLRSQVIGLLNRFRGALSDELDDNSSLPQNLDQQVFGYFDELEGMRVSSLAAAAASAKAARVAAESAKPVPG